MPPLGDRLFRRAVEKHLARELQEAHEAFRIACRSFSESVEPGPPAIPPPDSWLLSRHADDERRRAFAVLERVQARWNAFVLKGVIPDDLKDLT